MRHRILQYLMVLGASFISTNSYAGNPENTAVSKTSKTQPVKIIRVLIQTDKKSPELHGDSKGNAIIFANSYSVNSSLRNTQKENTSSKNIKPKLKLAYSLYNNLTEKWSKQLFVPAPDIGKLPSPDSFKFFNSKSRRSQILFVMSDVKKIKTKKAFTPMAMTVLWSVRKNGLLGKWRKPVRILAGTNGALSGIKRSCNVKACVIVWRQATANPDRNVKAQKERNLILFKSLLLGENESDWSRTESIEIPLKYNILQQEMVMLDSSNLALIWLAAVKPGQKKSTKPVVFNIFVRMRINNQWGEATKVAALGNNGGTVNLGNITVIANQQRKILIAWPEVSKRPSLRSVYYDKKWTPVATVYSDNPDVRNIFLHLSDTKTAVIYWQQKYGKVSHVFSSKFHLLNNTWSIPLKLDRGPQIATLANISTGPNSDVALMWIKEYRDIRFAIFNNRGERVAGAQYRQRISPHMSLPAIVLFKNQTIGISWLKSVKSGFEVWVQHINFKQAGVRQ